MTSQRPAMPEEALYPIGAVAALTDLPVNTIRTWERRHKAVQPRRTEGGGRRYTDRDVERLQLLRTLTREGVPIRDLASLELRALREREEALASHRTGTNPSVLGADFGGPLRIGLAAPTVAQQIRHHSEARVTWDVASEAPDAEGLRHALVHASGPDAAASVDAIIVSFDVLPAKGREAAVESLFEAADTGVLIVLYEFAPRQALALLGEAGARCVRGPLPWRELDRILREHLTARGRQPLRADATDAPARRFSEAQLAQLRELTAEVPCECPNHVAHIVTSLLAFERYSASCEDTQPSDAAVHSALARGTARARAEMERMLELVVAHEGLALPPERSPA